ncbi:MAG: preprotein translocase subunit SecG [Pirellulales bacterium]|nr:preprotein translocase subunit SecG [Pirellulales bacterium]
MTIFLMILMGLMAFILIVLVLIQRGRGGGLAGALGGAGGQSAFGTKAGDMFTRITIVTAAIWILLCIGTTKWVSSDSPLAAGATETNESTDDGTGVSAGAGDAGDTGDQNSGDGGQ